jgi:signal transduction histidine kinase
MLIVDILDLSKIEAGKADLDLHPIELMPFLDGICDIIRIKAEQKGLRFACQASPELPQVIEADEKRLRQVLLNLLGNAVKFTDKGEVTLAVRRVSGGSRVLLAFEVRDTGMGIAAEHLETIFLPFEQVGHAERRAGGTGLGLAISRNLVRAMGGDIHVESNRVSAAASLSSCRWCRCRAALPARRRRCSPPATRAGAARC